jgi:hypothetical protein
MEIKASATRGTIRATAVIITTYKEAGRGLA